MLDAPIRRGEVLHGVVCHEHVGDAIEWGGDAIQFAASVADFVALALESRERRRAESLTVGQNRVLELLAKGRGLEEVLETLTQTVEEHGDGMLCSVLVLDESGCRLRHGAAPNLPEAYNKAVDGLTIGPSAGSCGTAAYRGQRVIVEDIANDPLWVDYKEIAAEHDLGACWSEPILSADGTVLGTFAIYYRQARRPSETDLQTISAAAHLAGVAIENKRAEAMERKHREYVEAELRKVKQQLVNQTRLATVGQVAASISHELRNPLGAVNNAVYYLRRHLPAGEAKWEDYLDIIDHEVHVADGIITDLLEMSRAKEPHKLDADLGEVLDAARRSVPGADGVQWDVRLTPEPFVVRADSGQLRQVLTNLINNAVQAMDGDGRISIRANHDGNEDTITIEDSGPGVSAEDAARIFEPLFTTKAKGTGLGLAICRQIATRHGGQVELVETPQPGATFRLRLPRDTT